ncbi:anhydro-N-acetylmuramic acid kinase [Suttonella sp. R2A3]|uniref:anhydro-N-acetylmuramic acid kinase n=1 Tax=Suttonella sp. R2A3 TaxID=2908648 RepID=UPI001F2D5AC8|nr:anhydro-N-acetylmuramic acid kinase [Suttonella sp. R2A3]UJF24114.1 anhydro-N-acetylmuramic acid kinase [Suttonella sp. R2A3]
MSTPQYFIGIMSGTSLDGADSALMCVDDQGWHYLAHHEEPMPADLALAFASLNQPGDNELQRSALATDRLMRLYAQSVRALLAKTQLRADDIRAIGIHGQTVRHCPNHEPAYTIQLANPALLAELCGIDVIADFRQRDIAAGGQGAPLAPLFQRDVLQIQQGCVVNIGGIANLSIYQPDGVFGFDSGPGNGLLDAWIGAQLGKSYDEHGAWAASGRILEPLCERLLADAYFAKTPPKSSGRDYFDLSWLHRHLSGDEAAEDVQRTLLELTARSICDAVKAHSAAKDVILTGGGVRNPLLVSTIAEQLGPSHQLIDCPIDPQAIEAAGFAWLAEAFLRQHAHDLSTITGGKKRVLGALYPA